MYSCNFEGNKRSLLYSLLGSVLKQAQSCVLLGSQSTSISMQTDNHYSLFKCYICSANLRCLAIKRGHVIVWKAIMVVKGGRS